MNAIYMAINGNRHHRLHRYTIHGAFLCGVKFTLTEGNLGCHGLFALTPNWVKGIWVAGCAQGLEIAVLIRVARESARAAHFVRARCLVSR
jgi:hypothetical protein